LHCNSSYFYILSHNKSESTFQTWTTPHPFYINLSTRAATFGGSVTATSFIGPLTGNVTGALTGNATSATSASTASQFATDNWTISEQYWQEPNSGTVGHGLHFRMTAGYGGPFSIYFQNRHIWIPPAGEYLKHSDDRLKINESVLTHCLSVIDKLSVESYNLPSANNIYEIGFIAQEVEAIHELKHAIYITDTREYKKDDQGNNTDEIISGFSDTRSLNYNAIFTFNVGATQELHKIVKEQQIKIEAQQNSIQTQQTRIETLETKVERLERLVESLV